MKTICLQSHPLHFSVAKQPKRKKTASQKADDTFIFFFSGKMPKKKNIKRFGDVSDKHIEETRQEVQNKNTTNADKKWEKVFRDFLIDNEMDNDFYAFDTETLNKWLAKLWFGARNQKGGYYRANSVRSMKYALNRCLKKAGKEFDITTSDKFVHSQRGYADAMKQLKILGYGYVVSHKEIIPEGIYLTNSQSCLVIQTRTRPIFLQRK